MNEILEHMPAVLSAIQFVLSLVAFTKIAEAENNKARTALLISYLILAYNGLSRLIRIAAHNSGNLTLELRTVMLVIQMISIFALSWVIIQMISEEENV